MHFSRDSRKTEYPNKLKHLPWMTVFVLILLNSHFVIKTKGQPYTKKKQKNIIQKDIYTPMSIAALFTIHRTRKQSKCLSIEEWIKNIWYIYTMES